MFRLRFAEHFTRLRNCFRNRKSFAGVALIALGVCGPFTEMPLRASKNLTKQESTASATGQTDKNWDAIGLAFARIIIDEEKEYHAAHGRYASDLELSKSGGLSGATSKMTLKFGRDIFRKVHWAFQIDTSTDGQQYQLIVHSSQECQHVFFSNQMGQVYEGKQVNCR